MTRERAKELYLVLHESQVENGKLVVSPEVLEELDAAGYVDGDELLLEDLKLYADGNERGWLSRWRVLIECRDCGVRYQCSGASTSVERIAGFNRMFVAGGPEVCPECKNLKSVERKL